jgi:hypothetical protein
MMNIIGAGMSGLLAGHFFRCEAPTIFEAQSELPNNHKALLRFRSSIVSELTSIQFKKVKVQKNIQNDGKIYKEAPINLVNKYSQKTNGGRVEPRSISSLEDCERYIAPENFVSQLSRGLDIKYNTKGAIEYHIGQTEEFRRKNPLISTIPVQALAEMLSYGVDFQLKYRSIITLTLTLDDCDVYQTIYFPDSEPAYRASITGNKLIIEMMSEGAKWAYQNEDYAKKLLIESFGIATDKVVKDTFTVSSQKYGKLVEASDNRVRDFLGWATENYNIYSLGRWGTHRQLLMDDVVNDLKVIRNMINTNRYAR